MGRKEKNMETKEQVKKIRRIMEDKKGENIRIIDISQVSTIADYFVIVSAENNNQSEAIAEEIERVLARQGVFVKSIEGGKNASWKLMDYGDIIVHIFLKEDRIFYDIERIWGDGRFIDDMASL